MINAREAFDLSEEYFKSEDAGFDLDNYMASIEAVIKDCAKKGGKTCKVNAPRLFVNRWKAKQILDDAGYSVVFTAANEFNDSGNVYLTITWDLDRLF